MGLSVDVVSVDVVFVDVGCQECFDGGTCYSSFARLSSIGFQKNSIHFPVGR